MPIFARKRAAAIAPKQAPSDFRASKRRRVSGNRDLYEVEIDGVRAAVRDLSDGGVGVEIDEALAPRRGLLLLLRDGAVIRRVYAIRAWGRGQRVGYQLVNDLDLAPATNQDAAADLRARGLRRRLEAEIARRRQPAADGERARGGVAAAERTPETVIDEDGRIGGAALRARLRL